MRDADNRMKSHPVPDGGAEKIPGLISRSRRDLLQHREETLAFARADDAIEIALVPARAGA